MSISKQAIQTNTSNWVCCSLGLKYLKDGLEGVTERIINKQHKSFLATLPNLDNNCKKCSLDKLLPNHSKVSNSCPYNNRKCFCLKPVGRKRCPNDGFCSKYFDVIVQEHQYKDPNWNNTNLTQWNTCPWEVAVCYINRSGYKGKTGASMDCAALLSIIINDSAFEIDLGKSIIEECKKARDARNDISHCSNYEITDSKREEYIDLFKGILDKENFQSENGVKEAFENLTQLQTMPLTITSKYKQEADSRQLLEFKTYKLGVIEDIISLLKEEKSQGHSASVESFDLLLRYHLLLQHACRDTLIRFIERETKSGKMSVVQYLTRYKENICQSLKEDAHIEEIFFEDGRTITAFDNIELSLICTVVLSSLTYGEIDDLKNENLTERCFAIRSILKEAKNADRIPLNRNHLKQRCTLIQDSLIVLAMNENDDIAKCKEHVRNERSRDFKCKQLIMRHLFQMNNIETLAILLKEGAECMDINVLTDVREKLIRKEFNESNRNDLLDNEVIELKLALEMSSERGADLQHPEVIDYQISINCSSETFSESVNTT